MKKFLYLRNIRADCNLMPTAKLEEGPKDLYLPCSFLRLRAASFSLEFARFHDALFMVAVIRTRLRCCSMVLNTLLCAHSDHLSSGTFGLGTGPGPAGPDPDAQGYLRLKPRTVFRSVKCRTATKRPFSVRFSAETVRNGVSFRAVPYSITYQYGT